MATITNEALNSDFRRMFDYLKDPAQWVNEALNSDFRRMFDYLKDPAQWVVAGEESGPIAISYKGKPVNAMGGSGTTPTPTNVGADIYGMGGLDGMRLASSLHGEEPAEFEGKDDGTRRVYVTHSGYFAAIGLDGYVKRKTRAVVSQTLNPIEGKVICVRARGWQGSGIPVLAAFDIGDIPGKWESIIDMTVCKVDSAEEDKGAEHIFPECYNETVLDNDSIMDAVRNSSRG